MTTTQLLHLIPMFHSYSSCGRVQHMAGFRNVLSFHVSNQFVTYNNNTDRTINKTTKAFPISIVKSVIQYVYD